MLIGVTATAIEDDSCSWIVRYQFRQLQKNITTLTKLSAIVIDLGTTEQGTTRLLRSCFQLHWRWRGIKLTSCACGV
jgi:hypothetical protein